ncbi:MAG TPA: Spy/CpxP family protein refolding chaperone [Gemmatirosa sp.]
MSQRSMRPLRVAACIAVTFLAASTAAAQAPAPAPDSVAESPRAADAAPAFFLVDDALLTGIPLTAAQAQQVMSLRALRAEEVAAIQPEVTGAVRAMARAHARHDETSRRLIFAMLQTNMVQARTWAMVATRVLLTDEQRPRFDANARALLAGQLPLEPTARLDAPSAGEPSDRNASVTTASAGTPRRIAVRLPHAPAAL